MGNGGNAPVTSSDLHLHIVLSVSRKQHLRTEENVDFLENVYFECVLYFWNQYAKPYI